MIEVYLCRWCDEECTDMWVLHKHCEKVHPQEWAMYCRRRQRG